MLLEHFLFFLLITLCWCRLNREGNRTILLFFLRPHPTFSELAGVKNCAQRYRNRRLKTDYFDGLSIVPTLLGHDAEQQRHPHLYWVFAETNQIAVRRGDWKLVVIKGVLHLYNLETDLHEDHDLAAEHPAIVQQLVDIIHQEHVDSPLFPITLPLKFRL